MRVSKCWPIVILLTGLGSCIDPFTPDISESKDLLVVSGNISDQPGEHFVSVSRSAPFNAPKFLPVTGCVVRVEDEEGNGFTYTEKKAGEYSVLLNKPFLGLKKSYKLLIYTPGGEEYQSDFDPMLPCPPIEKLYFEFETQATEDPDISIQGIRFYIDVKGEENESGSFLWKLEETYKYHAIYSIQYFWDDVTLTEYDPPIDSLHWCYLTGPINELYTASSKYLVANELQHYPLTFVSANTPRLLYRYSLLVSQYSLSEEAYIYWEKAKSKLSETGGLYETQPASSSGNIHNVHDENEQVLGFFYASQVTETRINPKNDFDFSIQYYKCRLDTITNLREQLGGNNLVYMISLNEDGSGPPYGMSDPGCFDCTVRGGTTTIPDFWKEND